MDLLATRHAAAGLALLVGLLIGAVAVLADRNARYGLRCVIRDVFGR